MTILSFTFFFQVCIAPDYVMVEGEELCSELRAAMKKQMEEWVGKKGEKIEVGSSSKSAAEGDSEASGGEASVTEGSAKKPAGNPKFTKIITARHAERLQGLIDSAMGKKSTTSTIPAPTLLQFGSVTNQHVPPTIISYPPKGCALMKEEIFGPILALTVKDSVDDMIAYVNSDEKPLALYVFGGSKAVIEKVLLGTTSGGVGILVRRSRGSMWEREIF